MHQLNILMIIAKCLSYQIRFIMSCYNVVNWNANSRTRRRHHHKLSPHLHRRHHWAGSHMLLICTCLSIACTFRQCAWSGALAGQQLHSSYWSKITIHPIHAKSVRIVNTFCDPAITNRITIFRISNQRSSPYTPPLRHIPRLIVCPINVLL